LKNLFGQAHFTEHLTLGGNEDFSALAMAIFRRQAVQNPVYARYLDHLSVDEAKVKAIREIPFLPISFFKSHVLKSGEFAESFIFESSGTTGSINSRHYIKSISSYLANAENNFREAYGDPSCYCFLALLPSYLERGNSSLVAMADHFIKLSQHPMGGFFLYDKERLHSVLSALENQGQAVVLLGVTYALVDFAEEFQMNLKHTIVMETGGMKGRKKELTRAELHTFLKSNLGVESIHAEYGMTELQSQAYSKGEGFFRPSSTMKVLLRSIDDPFEVWESHENHGKTGAINVIDLANEDSIAFIATDDLGRFTDDGGFEILGRIDNADLRGCSLLAL
jgi:hypothetical protein